MAFRDILHICSMSQRTCISFLASNLIYVLFGLILSDLSYTVPCFNLFETFDWCSWSVPTVPSICIVVSEIAVPSCVSISSDR